METKQAKQPINRIAKRGNQIYSIAHLKDENILKPADKKTLEAVETMFSKFGDSIRATDNIAFCLHDVARCNSSEAILNVANCIGKLSGDKEAATKVAFWLGWIAFRTENGEFVSCAAERTMSAGNGEVAIMISQAEFIKYCKTTDPQTTAMR